MGRDTESELKYALTPAQFRRLRKRFPAARLVRQVNHYFDVPHSLDAARAGVGIRVRFTNGRAPVLTVKAPAGNGRRHLAGHSVRREVEARLTPARARALVRGDLPLASLRLPPVLLLRRILPEPVLERIAPIGHTRTTRAKAPFHGGTFVEMDRFEVGGRMDYELEVETSRPKATDGAVRTLFAELDIPVRPRDQSKLARFLRHYRARRR